MSSRFSTDRSLRFGPSEWLGAIGDLGVFIPIFLAMTSMGAVRTTPALVMIGLAYIVSALLFRVPLPVQPLKAVAAIVMAKGLGAPVVAAAALWMSALLFASAFLVDTRWMRKGFSTTIVKGIQGGIGFVLIRTGVLLALGGGLAAPSTRAAGWRWPSGADFWLALTLLVLPQLPLTLGNAVFGCADAASHYFGDGARAVTPRRLCLSLAAWNGAIGLVGGMPVCHGAGGLTAHIRFGARSPGATFLIGLAHLAIALFLRGQAPAVYRLIPGWLLGCLVIYVGFCHVLLVRGGSRRRWLSLAMGGVALTPAGLAGALALGIAVERTFGEGRSEAPSALERNTALV